MFLPQIPSLLTRLTSNSSGRGKPRPLQPPVQPSFSTLAKSSSTGVERPKIVTETFSRLWSLSISSTLPLKFANGPSTMRTCSLRSKTTFGLGRSCGVCTRLMMPSTSASVSGEGDVAEPTKPVTRGGAHGVPGVFVQVHFHQHIARIGHAIRNHLLAATHFDDFLRGDHHAANLVLQAERGHAALQAFFDFLLKARVGMDDVPLHAHRSLVPSRRQTS